MCILRFCDHNESCKRVYYKNDRFFSRFLSGRYDNVVSDGVSPEAKNSIYILTEILTSSLDFLRNNLYICSME